MADTKHVERAAAQLREFVNELEKKSLQPGRRLSPGRAQMPKEASKKDQLLETYEEYLGKLTPDERGQLHDLIKKMMPG
jgi:hypothetical protein